MAEQEKWTHECTHPLSDHTLQGRCTWIMCLCSSGIFLAYVEHLEQQVAKLEADLREIAQNPTAYWAPVVSELQRDNATLRAQLAAKDKQIEELTQERDDKIQHLVRGAAILLALQDRVTELEEELR